MRRTDLDGLCGECGQRDRGQANEQTPANVLDHGDGTALPRRADSRAEQIRSKMLSATATPASAPRTTKEQLHRPRNEPHRVACSPGEMEVEARGNHL